MGYRETADALRALITSPFTGAGKRLSDVEHGQRHNEATTLGRELADGVDAAKGAGDLHAAGDDPHGSEAAASNALVDHDTNPTAHPGLAGGAAFTTFRQPEPPTTHNAGDVWIDSDDVLTPGGGGGGGGTYQRAPVHVHRDGATYYAHTRNGTLITSGAGARAVINAAIQTCFDGGGGDVFLFAGVYELGSTGGIVGKRAVRLVGEHPGWNINRDSPMLGTLFRAVAGFPTGAAMVEAISTSAEDKTRFSVSTVGFDGAGVANTGVRLGAKDGILENLLIDNCSANGIHLTNGNLTGQDSYVGMRVLNPTIDMNSATGTRGVYVNGDTTTAAGSTDSEIINPRIFRCALSAIHGASGSGGMQILGGHLTNSAATAAAVHLAGGRQSCIGTYVDANGQGPWIRASAGEYMISGVRIHAGAVFAGGGTTRAIELGTGQGNVVNVAQSSSGGTFAYAVFYTGGVPSAGNNSMLDLISFKNATHLKNLTAANILVGLCSPSTTG